MRLHCRMMDAEKVDQTFRVEQYGFVTICT